MPRVKKLTMVQRRDLRNRLQDAIEQGGYPWHKSVLHMRRALGLTQEQFAKAFKLTKRQVTQIEAGTANPTIETLGKIGRPFGFQIGYIPIASNRPDPLSDDAVCAGDAEPTQGDRAT
jgi:putative transcriptional regulator